jgi:RES domain-containing protein
MPVVYLAESPAGALLEACVHTSANDVPPNYTLLGVEAEARVSLENLDMNILPANWTKRLEATREIGTAWLRERRSCLLRIPSALVPATFSVMLNPLHADAQGLHIQLVVKYPFDPRLKR